MTVSNYIKNQNGWIDARLDVFYFKKDGVFYAYSPALDVVGYGYNEEEAKDSFMVVLEDFFEFGIKKQTLEQDLTEHGWGKERNSSSWNWSLGARGKNNIERK